MKSSGEFKTQVLRSAQDDKVSGVQRVVGIDWSGRVDAAGQRRHIWAGLWTKDASGKTKREA